MICRGCGQEVRQDSPSTAARQLLQLEQGRRFMIAFPREVDSAEQAGEIATELREQGFVRVIADSRTWNLSSDDGIESLAFPLQWLVVIDRLTAGESTAGRRGPPTPGVPSFQSSEPAR